VQNTYQMFSAQYDAAFRAGAEAAMRAGLAYIQGLMPALLLPMVIAVGVLGAYGGLTKERMWSYGTRAAIFVWLVGSLAYIPMVWTLFADEIPNAIATVVNGGGQTIQAVQQFDVVNATAMNFTGRILEQATGLFQIGNAIAAWIARFFQKIFLDLIYGIWVCMRLLTYVLLAGGAFLMPFILFSNTRGWLMEFFGKLVAMMVWQLMTSILVKIMLTGMMTFLAAATSSAGLSLTQMIDTSFTIAGWFFICFIMVALVPAIAAIGSHAVGSAAIVQSTIVGGAIKAGRMSASGGRYAGAQVGRSWRRARRTK